MSKSNILLNIFFFTLAVLLLIRGVSLLENEGINGYLWTGIGVFNYSIVCIITSIKSKEDIITNSSAGEAFVIAIFLGPILTILLLKELLSELFKK